MVLGPKSNGKYQLSISKTDDLQSYCSGVINESLATFYFE